MTVESRLVDLQNKVAVLGAKLDALMKASMEDKDIKAIKYPPAEPTPTEGGHPYQYLLDREQPPSTIEPPIVLAEGRKPSDIIQPTEPVDMSTIPAPVTPTAVTTPPGDVKPGDSTFTA
jgi:hypothetical protein